MRFEYRHNVPCLFYLFQLFPIIFLIKLDAILSTTYLVIRFKCLRLIRSPSIQSKPTFYKRLFVLLCFVHTSFSTIIVPINYSFNALYTLPLVPNPASLSYLVEYKYAQSHKHACLTETNKPKHAVNKVIYPTNTKDLKTEEYEYMPGSTYWFNEYMHVGHVHFNIGLLQLLASTRIDRIIMQRAGCYAKLCVGIGTYRSYWGAFFAAAFAATNHSHIPIFIRWSWTERTVQANYVSVDSIDYEVNDDPNTKKPITRPNPIVLKPIMCFEHILQRGPDYYGNSYGSLSPETVQNFKSNAYSAYPIRKLRKEAMKGKDRTKSPTESLTESLIESPPLYISAKERYKILFSYRGREATRHIDNYLSLLLALRRTFPVPAYEVLTLQNSDPTLTSEAQIYAIATANVLITNHGAFEGNLIYMRNGTLLIELSGNYHNPEFRLFQQLAQQFGLFFARVQTDMLLDHQMRNFSLVSTEIIEIVDIVKDYFDKKPFLYNVRS